VSGTSKPSTYRRILTMKIDPSGGSDASGWTHGASLSGRQYPSSNTSPAINVDSKAMKVSNSSKVYVAGVAHNSTGSTSDDYAVAYFSSAGAIQDSVIVDAGAYFGFSNTQDELADLALDNSSNVFVTGGMITSSGSGNGYWATVRYDSTLATEKWAKSYSYVVEYSGAAGQNILVLPSGNIIVWGSYYNSLNYSGGHASKYANTDGSVLDTATTASPGTYPADHTQLKKDPTGPYVIASFTDGLDFDEVVKFDTSLTSQWATQTTALFYYTFGMAIDSSGNTWLGGWSDPNGSGTAYYLFLGEYSSSGSVTWDTAFTTLDHNGSDNGAFYGLTTDGSGGNIYVAGYTTTSLLTSTANQDFLLCRFSTGSHFGSLTHLVENHLNETNQPSQYGLRQNYPDPFNPSTKISYKVPSGDAITLKVYDVTGREVRTLIEGQYVDSGEHVVSFDATGLSSGTYFYRLRSKSGKFEDVRKMMFIK